MLILKSSKMNHSTKDAARLRGRREAIGPRFRSRQPSTEEPPRKRTGLTWSHVEPHSQCELRQPSASPQRLRAARAYLHAVVAARLSTRPNACISPLGHLCESSGEAPAQSCVGPSVASHFFLAREPSTDHSSTLRCSSASSMRQSCRSTTFHASAGSVSTSSIV